MLKVLLIDDDPEEYEIISSAFENIQPDATILQVSDCQDIHSTITKHNPDIVFMDINMPYLNGIDCLKSVRADKKYQNLPIIIYSTSSNKNDIQAALQHKANLYVVKPTDFNKLLSSLQMVLAYDWNLKNNIPLNKFLIS